MGFIFLLLMAGLFMYLLWCVFYKTLKWVVQPLVESEKSKDDGGDACECSGAKESKESNIEDPDKGTVTMTIKTLEGFTPVPEDVSKKAEKEPQKIPDSELWVYKGEIFPSKPTKDEISEIDK